VRAVLVEAFGVPGAFTTVPDPSCPPDGVVIAVGATGLCRSDWHGWMGHDPDITLPHVPGHEFAGVVSAVGPEVRDWTVGARVTVPFVCACGTCATCRRGDFQVCERQTQPGFTHWGSFAELVAVHHADVNLVALPDSMPFTTAASLGCRFATAYRAVVHRSGVAEGEWVAVHGCGGVGLSAVMIAAAQGHRVLAVDTSPVARRLAAEFGAELVLDPADGPVVAAIRSATGGGAAASLDALGSRATLLDSVQCLRPRGTHVQVGLVAAIESLPTAVMAAVIAGELQVVGSHGLAARDYPQMLQRIAAGELAPERLVQRTISLDRAGAELATMDSRPGAGITTIDVDVALDG
jgi:D-arabinose 1-dehydrogenase-like Zn-dependent alcohol dehydrogenase